jgi:hypothetical protein
MLHYKSEIQGVEWNLVEPLGDAIEDVLRTVGPSWNINIRGVESTLDVCAVCRNRCWTTRIAADTDAPANVVRWLKGLMAAQATHFQATV